MNFLTKLLSNELCNDKIILGKKVDCCVFARDEKWFQ